MTTIRATILAGMQACRHAGMQACMQVRESLPFSRILNPYSLRAVYGVAP